MRKPAFCICENKDTDQLRGDREADQRFCFRYTDSTIPLLPKSEILSLYVSSVIAQADLCRTWSETPKTSFLITRLIFINKEKVCCKNLSIIYIECLKAYSVSKTSFFKFFLVYLLLLCSMLQANQVDSDQMSHFDPHSGGLHYETGP